MDIVFVEYKVLPEQREAYLAWARELCGTEPLLEHYEGSDQPNLFVELWRGMSPERYAAFKLARQESEDRPWSELAGYVQGGPGKVHVWHFRRSQEGLR
ncbi:hypothetical protein ACFFNY_09255 [Paenibacillus hodogayensis]|uniref:NIPSNAP domain-containing protein n=1 Tax=Paenibacillus hodogayensis TaxID=279208 RepID=A0ABV5VTY5_9BACL